MAGNAVVAVELTDLDDSGGVVAGDSPDFETKLSRQMGKGVEFKKRLLRFKFQGHG